MLIYCQNLPFHAPFGSPIEIIKSLDAKILMGILELLLGIRLVDSQKQMNKVESRIVILGPQMGKLFRGPPYLN